ncbi:MAG TPA: acyl-CoA dehydrogenase family protein [Steroidobacteraceae bacterium]
MPSHTAAASPFYREEHQVFREQVRRFTEREILPHIDAWEDAGTIPRELHGRAAEAGILQIGYPEEYGGIEIPDHFYSIVRTLELARAGSGGLMAGLLTHGIACPPIVAVGTAEQKEKFLRPVLTGSKIAALAITEPGAGSDVASIKTTAARDGSDYIVNGQKTFITSGLRADYVTCAVRTGGEGMGGISLLLIETDRPGFSRTPLRKMGWHCSDTAALYFDRLRVPAGNLLGAENDGFKRIMLNFNGERLGIIAHGIGLAEVCYEDGLAYARERVTFGRPLIKNQVIRHKLVEMRMRLDALRAQLDLLTWRVSQKQTLAAEIGLLKVNTATALEWIVGEAMQIFGGAGYLRGNRVERIYRDTKIVSIGGGSLEVMKDLAARQLGY